MAAIVSTREEFPRKDTDVGSALEFGPLLRAQLITEEGPFLMEVQALRAL